MDIDKLFKVPKLPASGSLNKRKMPDNPTPEMLKKMKMDVSPDSSERPSPASNGTPPNQTKGKSRAVTVEDIEDVDMDRMEFAPGGDADYFAEEDDEGRLFGSGLTSEQKDILNIFDNAGVEGVQEDVSVAPFDLSKASWPDFKTYFSDSWKNCQLQVSGGYSCDLSVL
jgi:beta-catenin-like protein 1